jgi:hypothetical protein
MFFPYINSVSLFQLTNRTVILADFKFVSCFMELNNLISRTQLKQIHLLHFAPCLSVFSERILKEWVVMMFSTVSIQYTRALLCTLSNIEFVISGGDTHPYSKRNYAMFLAQYPLHNCILLHLSLSTLLTILFPYVLRIASQLFEYI